MSSKLSLVDFMEISIHQRLMFCFDIFICFMNLTIYKKLQFVNEETFYLAFSKYVVFKRKIKL